MKRYVVADKVPETSEWYLTAGKEYPLIEVDSMDAIISDNNQAIIICLERSSHLDGQSWRIVERKS